MIRLCGLCLGVLLVAGCGGADGGADSDGAADTARASKTLASSASPGGIWHAVAGPEESMSLFIAETGELTVMQAGPGFGAGAVIVNDGDQLTGSYTLQMPRTPPLGPGTDERPCELAGTVAERVSLQVTVTCRDGGGEIVTERRVSLTYDAAYESGSSLADVAGNYTFPFDAQSNILTISADGGLFGMYDNGPVECTVNGTVELIDSAFSLLRFELTFSNCAGPLAGRYEGETMTGLGWPDPPASASGAILVMLTELIEDHFEFVSVLYEPI